MNFIKIINRYKLIEATILLILSILLVLLTDKIVPYTYYLNFELDSPTNGYIQIYYDYGDGYSEKNSSIVTISEGNNINYQIKLPDKSFNNIRFDLPEKADKSYSLRNLKWQNSLFYIKNETYQESFNNYESNITNLHNIELFDIYDDSIILTTNGTDPYFEIVNFNNKRIIPSTNKSIDMIVIFTLFCFSFLSYILIDKVFNKNIISKTITIILIFTVLLIIIYKPYLFDDKLFIFIDNALDSYSQYWPNYTYISNYLREFGIPTYSFELALGSGIFWATTIMRVSLSDPFVLLLMIPDPKDLHSYFVYVAILKSIIAFLLFFIYSYRFLKIEKNLALLFAIIYGLSDSLILRGAGWYHYSTEMVFLPLFLMSIHSFLIRNRKIYLTLSYIWLFCYYPYLIVPFTILFLAYSIFLKEIHENIIIDLKTFKNWILALILSLLLSAPISWPNIYIFMTSGRTNIYDNVSIVDKISSLLEFFKLEHVGINIISFLPKSLLMQNNVYIAASSLLDSPQLYFGISIMFIFIFSLFIKSPIRKFNVSLFLLTVFYLIHPIISTLIGLGKSGYFKLHSFIPATLIIITSMVFISYLIDNKIKRDQYAIKDILSKILITNLLISIPITIHFYKYKTNPNQVIILLTIIIITQILIILFFYHKDITFRKKFIYYIVIISIFEITLFKTYVIHNRETINQGYIAKKEGYLNKKFDLIKDVYEKDKDTLLYRVSTPNNIVSLNDSLFHRYYGLNTYQSFISKNQIDFYNFIDADIIEGTQVTKTNSPNWLRVDNKDIELRGYLSEKYYLIYGIDDTQQAYLVKNKGDYYLYENPYYLPFGQYITNIVNQNDTNNMINNGSRPIDILRSSVVLNEKDYLSKKIDTNILDDRTSKLAIDPTTKDQFKVIEIDNDSFKSIANYNQDTPGFITFTLPYDNGWKAYINDKETKIHNVNYGIMGLYVEGLTAGDIIYFKYSPYLYREGLFALILVSLTLVVYKYISLSKRDFHNK